MAPPSFTRSSRPATTASTPNAGAAISEPWVQRTKRQAEVAALLSLGGLTNSNRVKAKAQRVRQHGRDVKLELAIRQHKEAAAIKYLESKEADASKVSDDAVVELASADMPSGIEQAWLNAPRSDARRHPYWNHALQVTREYFRSEQLKDTTSAGNAPDNLLKIERYVEADAQTEDALLDAGDWAVAAGRLDVIDILQKANGFDPSRLTDTGLYESQQKFALAADEGDLETMEDFVNPRDADGVRPQRLHSLRECELFLPTLMLAMGRQLRPVAFESLIASGMNPTICPQGTAGPVAKVLYERLVAALDSRKGKGKAPANAASDAGAADIEALARMLHATINAEDFRMENFGSRRIKKADLEAAVARARPVF